jgi:hypothetical protein
VHEWCELTELIEEVKVFACESSRKPPYGPVVFQVHGKGAADSMVGEGRPCRAQPEDMIPEVGLIDRHGLVLGRGPFKNMGKGIERGGGLGLP